MTARVRVPRPHAAALAVAAILWAAAALVIVDAMQLSITSTYGVGPKAAPFVIAGGLALLGMGHAVAAFLYAWPQPEPADLPPIFLILIGLALLIAIVALGGGFIPAVAVLFAATAAAFGRRAFVADLIIGAALAVAVYLVFHKLLTLGLPEGPIERLLG